jgi:carbonic anhydrase
LVATNFIFDRYTASASPATFSGKPGCHMKSVEIIYRYGPESEIARSRPADSDEARHRLDEGSKAFAALIESLADDNGKASRIVQVDPQDLGLVTGSTAAPRQRPFAAVLGCSDARVPIELIFNEGPNDLFVIRVAGNGLGNEVLGSLKYAVEHLGSSLKLIAVLGHSGCGAVSGAVDVFLEPPRYLPLATSHSLRNIVDRLLVVVQASAKRLLEAFGPEITCNPGYREALIEASIVTNAALAAYTLQQEMGSNAQGGLRAVYGVYLIGTRQVWAPHRGKAAWTGLADPPSNPATFAEFANAVVHSARITSLLKLS